jgi:UDP-N-acetylglucosamine:LPS N-acetylglucosamine transferase
MIISDTQARLAAEHLRSQGGCGPCPHQELSPELLERVLETVASAPDTRTDRVAEARDRLADGLDSHDVAAKMLSRIAADSLR